MPCEILENPCDFLLCKGYSFSVCYVMCRYMSPIECPDSAEVAPVRKPVSQPVHQQVYGL